MSKLTEMRPGLIAAEAALDAYKESLGSDYSEAEDPETVFADLVADLLQYADTLEISGEYVAERALDYYTDAKSADV